jgi:hypothetical protein
MTVQYEHTVNLIRLRLKWLEDTGRIGLDNLHKRVKEWVEWASPLAASILTFLNEWMRRTAERIVVRSQA